MKVDCVKKAESYSGIFGDFPQNTPTRGEPDGPLFGNGDIGVAVGGASDNLTFWIAKNDFWYASYIHEKGECSSGVKCFGTLEIRSETLKDAAFSAVQKIGTADVEMDVQNTENHLHIKAYAPYEQSLIVVELESEKGDIPIDVELLPLEESASDCSREVKGNTICVTKDYVRDAEWETRAAAFGRILEWNQTKGILREGEKITIAVSMRTNHDTETWLEQAKADAEELTPALLKEYRSEHLEWWHDFWCESGISIPAEPEVEKFWYGSHYLMACCCKAGKFAPGIFGNWITTNTPNWNGDYHLNYNYEAPWWAVYSSNKVALSEPYDRPLMEYIPKAGKNAQDRLECRGIYSKVGIGPHGLETSRMFNKDGSENEEIPYWGQKSNSAYAAVNMVMRFYSTWDKEYAKQYALPYLLKVADFWEDYLKFEDGRYIIYNDCIHENSALAKGVLGWVGENTPDYGDDKNPILTLGLLRMVFRALLDISEYLGEEEVRREKWEHIVSHLSDFPLQVRDGKTVFRYTEEGMDWCDGNSLGIQHIFPCGAIGLSTEEKLLTIARDTITAMHRWSDYNAFPTFFTAAVRVGYDADMILDKLKEQFLNHSFPNLFIYYGGGGIETCSAVPGCVNEMLFQSHENILRFFPVWDRKKDASFSRLRGYGAFVVSAQLEGGVVKDIELFSEKGRPCAVLCPWESGMSVFVDGEEVSCRKEEIRDGIVYRFDTNAGFAYEIRQKEN